MGYSAKRSISVWKRPLNSSERRYKVSVNLLNSVGSYDFFVAPPERSFQERNVRETLKSILGLSKGLDVCILRRENGTGRISVCQAFKTKNYDLEKERFEELAREFALSYAEQISDSWNVDLNDHTRKELKFPRKFAEAVHRIYSKRRSA